MTETLFNHREIFILLYSGNINEAIRSFDSKINDIEFTPFTRNKCLCSLNFGIYNYILLKENISLHDCCMDNEKKISRHTNIPVLEIAADIITSYGMDVRYLSQKYKNVHIRHAVSYIHEHLSETLTLEKVSEAININSTYFCQLFKKEVDMSFSDYVLLQRMKLAKRLLLITDYSIQDIALKCGFHSCTYFSTCFKKYSGSTPSYIRLKK